MSSTLINRAIRGARCHSPLRVAFALPIPRHAHLSSVSYTANKYVRQRQALGRPQQHLQQTRSMGSVSAIDSAIFRTLFGTEEIRQVSIISSLTSQINHYLVHAYARLFRFSTTNRTSNAVLMPKQH